jgi:hypothetical protein
MKAVLRTVVAAFLLSSPAFAESPSGTWNGLSDRFQVDTGYFRISASTVLRYNGPQGSGDIDFEKDLGLNQNANTFWLDATWRVGRRHQLKLGFTRLVRDRGDYTLQRDLTWGGQTYDAGLTATSSTGSDILGGYYRFAAFRNERFEIGPTIGIGYLSMNARIQATGTIGGTVSRSLDQKASTGSITGAVGGYANAWPAKRLALRGDFLYIKVTPGTSEASVTDWRLGADYYFIRNAGVGVQYKYDRYSYDQGILVSKLGGEITYKGVQVFLSFLF